MRSLLPDPDEANFRKIDATDAHFRKLFKRYQERNKRAREHRLAEASKSFANTPSDVSETPAVEYGLAEVPLFGPGFRNAHALNFSLSTVMPLRPRTTKRQLTLGNANWASADLSKGTRLARGGVGLVNKGNTCFVNSVLQALTFTPALVGYLLHLKPDAERQKLQQHTQEAQLRAHQHRLRSPVSFCMLSELELHVRRAIVATRPFCPGGLSKA